MTLHYDFTLWFHIMVSHYGFTLWLDTKNSYASTYILVWIFNVNT